ncbi:MAG: hypothetical protein ACI9MC_001210, partial [Kiritimatiellia bacterium]
DGVLVVGHDDLQVRNQPSDPMIGGSK